MSNFVTSSIGRKFFMSITGLFLMVFLFMHMSINLLILFDKSGNLFNEAAHFMVTNPMIKIMELVLALGFLVHIIWSFIITLQNKKARPARYAASSPKGSFASRNMMILGAMVLVFIILHMMHFFVPIKVTGEVTHATVNGVEMHDAAALVVGLFKSSFLYCVLYVLGGILVGLHITHGFWSAFQTIGFSNKQWEKRLKCVATLYAIIVTLGYCAIPIVITWTNMFS